MKIFVLAPNRAYGLATVVPIQLELKQLYPEMESVYIFFRKNTYDDLLRDKVMSDLVSDGNNVVCCFGSTWLQLKYPFINALLKLVQLTPQIIKILVSRKSIVLFPQKIEHLLTKAIALINGVSGKNYTYLLASSSFKENYTKYFDEFGKRRPGKRERKKHINAGDGLLIFHKDNLPYLNTQGFRDCEIIGYPMMFQAYHSLLKESAHKYLLSELDCSIKNGAIITIFFNKYYGKTANRSDEWARETLSEAILAIRDNFDDSTILIRPHPMVDHDFVAEIVDDLALEGIFVTDLNIFTLSYLSKCVVSIAPSSSTLQSLSCGVPAIDYGRVGDEFYKLFPLGSQYSDFGVQVAYTQKDLTSVLSNLDDSDRWIDAFNNELDHTMDLSVFTNYWLQGNG